MFVFLFRLSFIHNTLLVIILTCLLSLTIPMWPPSFIYGIVTAVCSFLSFRNMSPFILLLSVIVNILLVLIIYCFLSFRGSLNYYFGSWSHPALTMAVWLLSVGIWDTLTCFTSCFYTFCFHSLSNIHVSHPIRWSPLYPFWCLHRWRVCAFVCMSVRTSLCVSVSGCVCACLSICVRVCACPSSCVSVCVYLLCRVIHLCVRVYYTLF